MYAEIRQWAHDRNIINGSTPARQFKKLMEEFGELGYAVAVVGDANLIKDAIGDIAVVLTIMAAMESLEIESLSLHTDLPKPCKSLGSLVTDFFWVLVEDNSLEVKEACYNDAIYALKSYSEYLDYDFTECLEFAYDQIKDRKGQMVNGIFVKEK